MKKRLLQSALALVVGSLAVSCGTPSGGGPNPAVNLPAPGEPVSLSNHVQTIFTAHCASCHRDGGGASVLVGIDIRLDNASNSFATLVNQPSAQDSNFTLVKENDSANSLLYLKVSSSNPPVGSRMPFLSSPLSDDEIRVIKDWIDQGALNN